MTAAIATTATRRRRRKRTTRAPAITTATRSVTSGTTATPSRPLTSTGTPRMKSHRLEAAATRPLRRRRRRNLKPRCKAKGPSKRQPPSCPSQEPRSPSLRLPLSLPSPLPLFPKTTILPITTLPHLLLSQPPPKTLWILWVVILLHLLPIITHHLSKSRLLLSKTKLPLNNSTRLHPSSNTRLLPLNKTWFSLLPNSSIRPHPNPTWFNPP